MCNCGCNTCETKKPALILNESVAPRGILSEGLSYHLDANRPLTEHLYRAGSTNYFNLWAEARSFYSRGIIEIINKDDLAVLTETNLGEYGIIYEIEIGDRVKASKEYGGLSGEVVDIRGSFIVVKTKEGNQSYHESDLKVLNREGKKVPLDFPMLEENEEISFKKGDTVYDKHTKAKLKVTRIFKDKIYVVPFNFPGRAEEWYRKEELTKQSFFQENKITTDQLLNNAKTLIVNKKTSIRGTQFKSGDIISVQYQFDDDDESFYKITGYGSDEIKINHIPKKEMDNFLKHTLLKEFKENKPTLDSEIIKQIKADVNSFPKYQTRGFESFKKEVRQRYKITPKQLEDILSGYLTESKENKPIGKPTRSSSGGKAYKVYVRDPKTKKIKTVRFGSGGLRAKINDPKARKAFAARHKCSTKNDKTKASYWSCRLPRYAKLLGLKSSFSGFW